ncbi:MAG: peptide-methionine (S)-S-oxide reductase MsrA [Opitutae bacterium]|jgi:peptide-methionine (S)-S-oxide reductase|nr:peptide-methionine (S)-S-oxide reductase MsrA [Opitutae bacterium]
MNKLKILKFLTFFAVLINVGCLPQDVVANKISSKSAKMDKDTNKTMETSILGGGCFWCTEAVYERIDGIKDVISGYAGGEIANPTYKQICTGKTGHAEVIKIISDPTIISYSRILEIFGDCHNPTTLNRQGADKGTQYRSTIMYLSESQKKLAQKWKDELSQKFEDPIVTEIVPAPVFYTAEDYHQDYYRKNPNQGYCSFVIRPKLKKLNLE